MGALADGLIVSVIGLIIDLANLEGLLSRALAGLRDLAGLVRRDREARPDAGQADALHAGHPR